MTDTQQLAALIKACDFAAKKHRNQKRKDGLGTPYINHPLGVANIIAQEGGITELDVLQAAVLHDTVEDTGTLPEEIEKVFGVHVRSIVAEVTDDKSLSKVQRKKHQVEAASHKTRQAKLVKLGDKLYNCRDLLTTPPPDWSLEQIQGYFVWAKAVVAKLRGTNKGLEDALDQIFASTFTWKGNKCPCVPEGDLEQHLNKYYEAIEGKK